MKNSILNFEYKGTVAISYCVMFVEGAINAIIVALMVILSSKFNRPSGDIATLVAIKSLGSLCVLFVVGKTSDKIGRKIPISVGLILAMIFIVCFALTDNYYIAMVLALISGISHGLTDSPAMSLLFDALSGKNTGPALSIVQVFFAGGGVFTTLLASIIIKYNLNYILIFALLFIINIGVLSLSIFCKYPPLVSSKEKLTRHVEYENKPTFKNEGKILLLCALSNASFQSIVMTWLPTYIEKIKGFDVASSVAMLSSFQIGAVTGAIVFALVLRRVHSIKILFLNPILSIMVFMVLFIVNNPFIILVAVLCLGFLMGTIFSLCVNMGGELFSDNAGAATGAIGTSSIVGGAITVWVSGRLINYFGVGYIFTSALVLLFILIIFTNIFRIKYLNLKPSRR
ncbi:MAG: MFS transporter [Erysipelotrichaceae bacterium]